MPLKLVENSKAKPGEKEKPKKIKLLLVDDHPMSSTGSNHTSAPNPTSRSSGRHQWTGSPSQGQADTPRLVLMDISMPHMNGLEAMVSLRKQVPDAKSSS